MLVPHCSQTYDTSTKSFENIIFLGSPGIIARLQPGHITTGSVRIRSGRIPSIDWEYARCGAVPGFKSEHMLHCNARESDCLEVKKIGTGKDEPVSNTGMPAWTLPA